ncbi:MAG: hypothetical protein H7Y11_07525, partial [Armatimonadetes bacterium]|nr:hypothetical protein [Anaerolineae bacterium]
MMTLRKITLLVLLTLLLATATLSTAQETPPADTPVGDLIVEHPGLAADCARIAQLMDMPKRPEDMIAGGGIIIPNNTVSSLITPDDAGDRWVFASGAFIERPEIQFTISDNQIPLEARIFRGMALLDRIRIPEGGEAITFIPPQPGYYTLVVVRPDIADTTGISTYALTAQGDLALGLEQDVTVNGAVGGQVRSQGWIFYNQLAPGQNEVLLTINLNTDQPLRTRLLLDGELVQVGGDPTDPEVQARDPNRQIPSGRRSYTVTLDQNAYYTLIIAPDDNNVVSTYSLSLSSTGDPK